MEVLENITTESKVIIENGKIKTIFSEETERTGYMTIEECAKLLHASINARKKLLRQSEAGSK